MKRLNRWGFATIAAAVLLAGIVRGHAQGLPSGAADKEGISAARLAALDRRYQAGVDAGEIPGAVVMIARNGRLVYERAFGLASSANRTADDDRHAVPAGVVVQAGDVRGGDAAGRAGPVDAARTNRHVPAGAEGPQGRRRGRRSARRANASSRSSRRSGSRPSRTSCATRRASSTASSATAPSTRRMSRRESARRSRPAPR